MEKPILFYIQDDFADWEGAFITPILREKKVPFTVVSEKSGPVTSLGGLRVQAENTLSHFKPNDVRGIILPGGDPWANPELNKEVLQFTKEVFNQDKMVAAICAATVAVSRIGLLEERKHTSNMLPVLKQLSPSYKGEHLYQKKMAVRDGNLITAPGTGAMEFTFEIMTYLNLYDETNRKHWYNLFKEGKEPPMEFWSA